MFCLSFSSPAGAVGDGVSFHGLVETEGLGAIDRASDFGSEAWRLVVLSRSSPDAREKKTLLA